MGGLRTKLERLFRYWRGDNHHARHWYGDVQNHENRYQLRRFRSQRRTNRRVWMIADVRSRELATWGGVVVVRIGYGFV